MASASVSQHLSFQLAGEEFAVPILVVREILQCDTLTPVPSTPAFIRGVIHHRGRVLPVVDLGVKLGLREATLTRLSCVVVLELTLEGEPMLLGALVDRVSQVLDLGPGDIEPRPSFGPRVRVDYLAGMGKRDGRLVLLLDVERVLTASELQQAGAATEPPAEEAQETQRDVTGEAAAVEQAGTTEPAGTPEQSAGAEQTASSDGAASGALSGRGHAC